MIAVTGARGFVGRAVCREFESHGERVLRIGRRESDVQWPATGAEFGAGSLARMSGLRAVVHLAGEPIGARWTARRRRSIRESRVGLTATLAQALASLVPRPSVLVSASAVGIYGDCGDAWLDESSRSGDGFLATVAHDWEAATAPAGEAGIRVVHLRMGVVLGRDGGMISRLRLPFQLAMGARLGRGTQWMSWISLADLVRIIVRVIDDESIAGPVNAVSPEPVTNAAFTRGLAHALGRPAPFAIPRFVLRAAFGGMADGMLLASQRAQPVRMLAAGFAFAHRSLDDALRIATGP